MSRFDLPTSTFLKHSSGGAGRLVLWPLSHDLATHRHSYAGEPAAALAAANVFCRDRPYRCGDRRPDIRQPPGKPAAAGPRRQHPRACLGAEAGAIRAGARTVRLPRVPGDLPWHLHQRDGYATRRVHRRHRAGPA